MKRIARLARSVLAAWCAAACTRWSEPYAEPPMPRTVTEWPQARVNLRDGRSLVLHHVHVRSDSVVGMVWRHGFHPFGVAREDVRGIQVREIHAARTLLLTGTLVGGLFWTIRRAIREGMTT